MLLRLRIIWYYLFSELGYKDLIKLATYFVQFVMYIRINFCQLLFVRQRGIKRATIQIEIKYCKEDSLSVNSLTIQVKGIRIRNMLGEPSAQAILIPDLLPRANMKFKQRELI